MPARFTDSLVAAVRRRYEDTDQLVISIAAEFGVGERTINRWIAAHGWRKRSLRTRGLPIALQLLEDAKGLDPRLRGDDSGVRGDDRRECGPSPSRLGASRLAPQDDGDGSEVSAQTPASELSPVDRLEALVVKEIEAEEAAQARRRGKHSTAKTSESSARTLATLTQTLDRLHRIRAGLSPEQEISDDGIIPDEFGGDIDAFRRELARRIEAFMASRPDDEDAGDDAAPPEHTAL